MTGGSSVSPENVRRVRRLLNVTQAQFARHLGVDPVTVARWETGQRRCAGRYAEAVRGLAPPPSHQAQPEAATVTALAQLARTLFHGSTATAVSALLDNEALSDEDLDALAQLIEAKRRTLKRSKEEER